MVSIRKAAQEMANVYSNGGAPRWMVFFQTAINMLVVALLLGVLALRDTANSASAGVTDHERRIEQLESSPARISVLESKVDDWRTDSNHRLDRMEQKIDALQTAISENGRRGR